MTNDCTLYLYTPACDNVIKSFITFSLISPGMDALSRTLASLSDKIRPVRFISGVNICSKISPSPEFVCFMPKKPCKNIVAVFKIDMLKRHEDKLSINSAVKKHNSNILRILSCLSKVELFIASQSLGWAGWKEEARQSGNTPWFTRTGWGEERRESRIGTTPRSSRLPASSLLLVAVMRLLNRRADSTVNCPRAAEKLVVDLVQHIYYIYNMITYQRMRYRKIAQREINESDIKKSISGRFEPATPA